MRRRFMLLAAAVCAALTMLVVAVPAQDALSPREELGRFIFFDASLSLNNNQSCATCHGPAAGWTGPDSAINAHGAVYEGSVAGRFGDRKPPSAAYATPSPILSVDKKGLFAGGNFWDGRATGERLGNPAAEQAEGPFLNPMEQALPSPAAVISRVCAAGYNGLFMDVCGTAACSGNPNDVPAAYDCIGYSVAAYEASPEVNAFSSKFDYMKMGMASFTHQEERGRALFQGKAKCARCHLAGGRQPLFTDYTFDNLGLPKNPENPFYAAHPDYLDRGLGGYLESRSDYEALAAANMGKHKVPTTRNVGLGLPAITKAYGHNGYFKSLEGIVHFYNTRDVKGVCLGAYTEAQALAANCWPAPEIPTNVNTAELGNLGLSKEDELAIVAFLKTLSDGYTK